MEEDEKNIIEDAFSSIRVYITNLDELKSDIEKLEDESENLNNFIAELETLTTATRDPTKKADQRILLNRLKDYVI